MVLKNDIFDVNVENQTFLYKLYHFSCLVHTFYVKNLNACIVS